MTTGARYPAKKALLTGCIAAFTVGLASSQLYEWTSTEFFNNQAPYNKPLIPIGTGVISSIFVGMAIGSYISLWHENMHRLKVVFKLNTGRLLATLFLALLSAFTPWEPVAANFIFAFVMEALHYFIGGRTISVMTTSMKFILVALPIAYIVSSLIISGTRSRFLRVFLFGQAWLATYAAMILIHGITRGGL